MIQRALGTTIQIGANIIAGLTSIAGLELSAETIDITTLSSSGGYREFTGGFKDGGEVGISGHFDAQDTNGQIALYDAFQLGSTNPYTIIFPGGGSWTFSGVVTGFTTGAELEDTISFEATIKVSGAPSFGLTQSGGLTALAVTGTGGTLAPAFAAGNRVYSFSGVTAVSATVTATAAAHTLKLYIDGVYSQDLVTGSPSAAIPLTINVGKRLTIIAYEASKAPKIYDVSLIKTA
ncbi:histidine kinase [Paenibacillus sp. FSL H8-0548]|uniref:phage tail tube protein n=1 Tax=Paenibacillus sp. FSL H8-0548 TaxID=1920422 RepID=UPI00096F2BB0|nr:phage tail tube protein [Paenibacillus sp. FSL H8-0548]OMF35263.1 histidine kinase [Paenibacillus sp. FSL H8-0548]